MTIANYFKRNNLVENDLEFGNIILNNALLKHAAKDYQDLLIGLEENELKGSKFFALIERAFPFLREEYEAANKKIDFNKFLSKYLQQLISKYYDFHASTNRSIENNDFRNLRNWRNDENTPSKECLIVLLSSLINKENALGKSKSNSAQIKAVGTLIASLEISSSEKKSEDKQFNGIYARNIDDLAYFHSILNYQTYEYYESVKEKLTTALKNNIDDAINERCRLVFQNLGLFSENWKLNKEIRDIIHSRVKDIVINLIPSLHGRRFNNSAINSLSVNLAANFEELVSLVKDNIEEAYINGCNSAICKALVELVVNKDDDTIDTAVNAVMEACIEQIKDDNNKLNFRSDEIQEKIAQLELKMEEIRDIVKETYCQVYEKSYLSIINKLLKSVTDNKTITYSVTNGVMARLNNDRHSINGVSIEEKEIWRKQYEEEFNNLYSYIRSADPDFFMLYAHRTTINQTIKLINDFDVIDINSALSKNRTNKEKQDIVDAAISDIFEFKRGDCDNDSFNLLEDIVQTRASRNWRMYFILASVELYMYEYSESETLDDRKAIINKINDDLVDLGLKPLDYVKIKRNDTDEKSKLTISNIFDWYIIKAIGYLCDLVNNGASI